MIYGPSSSLRQNNKETYFGLAALTVVASAIDPVSLSKYVVRNQRRDCVGLSNSTTLLHVFMRPGIYQYIRILNTQNKALRFFSDVLSDSSMCTISIQQRSISRLTEKYGYTEGTKCRRIRYPFN